jgi:hypothetical protein
MELYSAQKADHPQEVPGIVVCLGGGTDGACLCEG